LHPASPSTIGTHEEPLAREDKARGSSVGEINSRRCSHRECGLGDGTILIVTGFPTTFVMTILRHGSWMTFVCTVGVVGPPVPVPGVPPPPPGVPPDPPPGIVGPPGLPGPVVPPDPPPGGGGVPVPGVPPEGSVPPPEPPPGGVAPPGLSGPVVPPDPPPGGCSAALAMPAGAATTAAPTGARSSAPAVIAPATATRVLLVRCSAGWLPFMILLFPLARRYFPMAASTDISR
jgi:hypothetical protein